MDLKINFNTNPVGAAQELAVDLGDSSKNWKAWHRAITWLDEQGAGAITASQKEQGAAEKAAAIRCAEHVANTRQVLAALYYKEGELPGPSATAERSASKPISEAEIAKQEEEHRERARETVLGRMNETFGALFEAHPDDEVKARYLTCMKEVVLLTGHVDILKDSTHARIDATDKSVNALGKVVMEIIDYIRARDGRKN